MDLFKKPLFEEMEQTAFLVASLLEQKKATLAVAESLTGGLVSHLLTLKPGASQFFLGSIVCYSSAIKTKHLDIPKNLLEQKGVVSKALALLMAQNVKKKWESNYGLSLTGLAGPHKEEGDPPIGTVFIGFSGPKGDKVKKLFIAPPTKKAQKVPLVQAFVSKVRAMRVQGIPSRNGADFGHKRLLNKSFSGSDPLEARWFIQQKSAFLALEFLKTGIEGH